MRDFYFRRVPTGTTAVDLAGSVNPSCPASPKKDLFVTRYSVSYVQLHASSQISYQHIDFILLYLYIYILYIVVDNINVTEKGKIEVKLLIEN